MNEAAIAAAAAAATVAVETVRDAGGLCVSFLRGKRGFFGLMIWC
jgi:hypothetical protein